MSIVERDAECESTKGPHRTKQSRLQGWPGSSSSLVLVYCGWSFWVCSHDFYASPNACSTEGGRYVLIFWHGDISECSSYG